MTFFQRSIALLFVICLGCTAQSVAPGLNLRIERQVRNYYSIPNGLKIEVGTPKPSEFPNYDALTVTVGSGEQKRDLEFLLSKDGGTLVRWSKIDVTKDPFTENMKKMDVQGRPVRGNKDAKVVAVNYDDFQCSFCSRMHATLFPEILKEYGDRVLFIYKDYPIDEIHPWARHAAVNANCLAAQNNDAYWDFADHVHLNQKDFNSQRGRDAQFAALDQATISTGQQRSLDIPKLQACVKAQNDSAIKASIVEGEKLGVDGTPAFFVNGQKVGGALPIEDLRAALDAALDEAGVAKPARSTVSAQGLPTK